MRKHDIAVDLDATPDEVWDAVTQGEQITRWFAPIATVEPGAGGSIEIGWSPEMKAKAPIRVWEPGKRFAWVQGEGTEREQIVEWQIEAKDEGKTTLRLVHSGFGDDAKFDDEYDNTKSGWLAFLDMLRYGLAKFKGVPAKNVAVFRFAQVSQPVVWDRCKAALVIDTTTVGASYTAKLGKYDLAGKVLGAPKEGLLILSVKTLENSLLGVFVEGKKNAMVTIMWVLFGNAAIETADVVERALTAFADEITASTDSSASPA